MARLLSKSTWEKFSVFHKEWPFLAQNVHVFISDFLVQIRNQYLRIDSCAKFQPNWTKDNGAQILTCNDTENSLITSAYLIMMTSEKLLWLLGDFVPEYPIEYHHAKFGGNWKTNKGEAEG